MRVANKLLLVPAMLLLSPVADAAKEDGLGLELTPFVGFRFGGQFEDADTGADYDLDDSVAGGFLVNWPATQETEWEIYYSFQSTDVYQGNQSVGEFDISYLQLGGTYLFEQSRQSQPYFVATIGVTHIDPADYRSDNFFSFAAGGGWKYFPDKRIGLRLDGRFIGTLVDSDSRIFCETGNSSTCLFSVSGDVLWQFELQAGVVFRF